MKALITGSEGFVGRYLTQELRENGYDVVGMSRAKDSGGTCEYADLMDEAGLCSLLERVRPDMIFHLAGQSNVQRSWREPTATMQTNLVGSMNLLDAVRTVDKNIRLLLVGSSDEYGVLGDAGGLVDESMPLSPASPYAVSKAAAERMAKIYAKNFGLDICMTRSFNHCGAGQNKGFIISDFASGIAEIEKGMKDRLVVGNLESRRDYTHVRDIVRAYRLLAENGETGEVYNVGSGESHSGREILDMLCSMAAVPILVETDADRLRPSDTPLICCDNRKLRNQTGWAPAIPFEEILRDSLEYWRGKVQ